MGPCRAEGLTSSWLDRRALVTLPLKITIITLKITIICFCSPSPRASRLFGLLVYGFFGAKDFLLEVSVLVFSPFDSRVMFASHLGLNAFSASFGVFGSVLRFACSHLPAPQASVRIAPPAQVGLLDPWPERRPNVTFFGFGLLVMLLVCRERWQYSGFANSVIRTGSRSPGRCNDGLDGLSIPSFFEGGPAYSPAVDDPVVCVDQVFCVFPMFS